MAASNLTIRLATAVVMVPLIIALLLAGPAWGWLLFMLAAAALGIFELFSMSHPGDRLSATVGVLLTWAMMLAMWIAEQQWRALLAIVLIIPIVGGLLTLARVGDIRTSAFRLAVASFGPLYIGGGLGAAALIRTAGGDEGGGYVILALVLSWMSDTGAYFGGRLLGKHKLYRKVSPGKTAEGAVSGVIVAILAALVARWVVVPSLPVLDAIILGLVGSVLGQMGDLGESLLKRSVGVKDSGGIVPGHGGILDRIDAVLVTAPLTLLYLLFS